MHDFKIALSFTLLQLSIIGARTYLFNIGLLGEDVDVGTNLNVKVRESLQILVGAETGVEIVLSVSSTDHVLLEVLRDLFKVL